MQQPKNCINRHHVFRRATRSLDFVSTSRFSGDFSSQKKHGFTLMEMLVVMAILAILSAIAVPTFSNARQKAQSIACQGNLRTISTALHAYVADHDGRLIPAMVYAYNRDGGGWYSADRREGGFWYTVLDPYVNPGIDTERDMRADKRDVWPLATRAKYAQWQLCSGKNPKLLGLADDFKAIGYGWNAAYFGSTTDSANPSYNSGNNVKAIDSRMSQVERPGSTVIIGDSKDADDTFQAYQNQYLYESEMAGGVNIRPKRHSGGGNYLFLDGHIEWMTPKQVNERVLSPDKIFKKVKS